MRSIPKKTVGTIIESGNHYLLQLKGNQPSLQQEMGSLILERPLDHFTESEKGHGRHSEWSVSVHDASQSSKAQEWCCLRRLIHVHKTVSDIKTGEVTHSDRLYISDLFTTDAAYYAKAIRGHWSIENNLHRVKDVLHGEDDNGVAAGNAAINISTISSMALNIHRISGRDKIKKAQMFAASNAREIICELRT